MKILVVHSCMDCQYASISTFPYICAKDLKEIRDPFNIPDWCGLEDYVLYVLCEKKRQTWPKRKVELTIKQTKKIMKNYKASKNFIGEINEKAKS